MKIINETELMTNHKASTVIVPDKQFEALQTIEGNALLFSIGTDGILYCTREVSGDTHGWVRVDLSSALSGTCYGGAAITAETFDIAQDMTTTNSVDIALVVNCNGTYYLHLVTDFTNTFANWTSGAPVFGAGSQYKFDYPGDNIPAYQAMPINDVQIADSNDGNAMQYIIVDLVSNAATQTISRFYIDATKQRGYAWLPHDLSGDLQAGTITTFLGCGPNDGPDSYPGAGDGAGNNIGGAYVLGSLAGKPQLQYTPAYDFNHPEETPDPTVFNFPAGTNNAYMAMGVSSSASNAPYTDLFFATNGQLYFLACADQNDSGQGKPTPVSIYTHDLFQNIQSLHVKNWNDNIVIWGQSAYTDPKTGQITGQLFIMEGVAGQETNADAWSCPIPLLFNVVNSSAYVNNIHSLDSSIDTTTGNAYGSCSVLFAQQVVKNDDGTYSSFLTQLFQDPVTTAWQVRSLLTAPSSENIQTVIYETTTYSTHIEITDDSSTVQPNVIVNVWASSPCSVYISDLNNNAAYHTLSNDTPLELKTDYTGTVTIMQPVDTIGGISYYVAAQDPVTKYIYTEVVNPLSATSGTIATLNTKVPDGKDHLQGVTVYDEYNQPTQLVSSVYNDQTALSSSNINTICQQNVHMNADGLVTGQSWPDEATVAAVFAAEQPVSAVQPEAATVKPGTKSRVSYKGFPVDKNRVKKFARADRPFKDLRFNPKTDKIWGWTYGKNAAHYEGIEAIKAIGVLLNADGSLSLTQANTQLGSGLHIEAKLGHVVSWMKKEASKLTQVVITFVNGAVDCVLTIAGDFYHFLAKCANDIVNLVHTVLNAVETAFEDIVRWIGSIMGFADIYRTHQVLKNFIELFLNNCLEDVSCIEGLIATAFGDLKTNIANLTGLPDSDQSYNGNMSSATPTPGSTSPTSHWGTHHLKSNASNGSPTNYTTSTPDDPGGVLGSLESLFSGLEANFKNAANSLQTIGKTASSEPVTTVIKQVMGVIGELMVDNGQDLITATVNTLGNFLQYSNNMLTSVIEIPVISYLYGKITAFMNPNHEPDPFTLLDALCLISAIPVTIVYKIANGGDAPFPDDQDTTNFMTVKDIPTFQSYFTTVNSLGDHEGNTGGNYVTNANQLKWMKITNIFGFIGSYGVNICSGIKAFFPSQLPENLNIPNRILSALNSVSYMAYVSPDIYQFTLNYKKWDPKDWAGDMNTVCTWAATAKAIVDGFTPYMPSTCTYGSFWSPWLDYFINMAWQIPTTVPFVQEMLGKAPSLDDCNQIVEFIGVTTFDLSGMASPVLANVQNITDPESRFSAITGTFAVIAACNFVWGISGMAVSFDRLPIPA